MSELHTTRRKKGAVTDMGSLGNYALARRDFLTIVAVLSPFTIAPRAKADGVKEIAKPTQQASPNTQQPIPSPEQNTTLVSAPRPINPMQSHVAAEDNQDKEEVAAESQARAAWGEFWIGVFGTAAVLANLYFTRKASEAAARAATVAEKALVDVERPWLVMNEVKIQWRKELGERTKNNWFVSFNFRNVGRMPACVTECGVCIVPKEGLPKTPSYDTLNPLTMQATVSAGETGESGQIGPAPGREEELVVFGKIVYEELSGRQHMTGFSVALSPHFPAFVKYPGGEYDHRT